MEAVIHWILDTPIALGAIIGIIGGAFILLHGWLNND